MLDKTKVLYGPFDLTLKTGEVDTLVKGTLKKEAVTISTEDITEELEDYTTVLVGRRATVEVVHSEVDSADLALINDTIDGVEVAFSVSGKKLTVAAPDEVRPTVEGGKTKITIKKFVKGDAWPFAIAAV
jgi:hypothetical protein